MTLPLAGVRIISVEQYGAGPFGTQHLADLGAEVIKIENPNDGGDVGRGVGPYFFEEGDSHFFQSFNRNKKSMTLDLKQPEGKAILHKLVAEADAVFDNLRGDLPVKLGLTYADLKEHNPAIVCAHLSAYGREGERKAWPGYDYLMQAEAGYLSLTGEPGGPPARFGISIIDMMTGTTAAMALLAGLVGARATGVGRDVDVSLYDVAMHNLNYLGTWYLNEGVVTSRTPRSGHPSLTPSQLYRTQDGWMFIMCNKEKFWGVLANLIDKPEWTTDERFCNFKARLANRDELTEELDAILMQATTEQWMTKFAGKVPAAPVNDIAQALDNPFAIEQGSIVDVEHPVRGPVKTLACPVRCPGEQLPSRPAPRLGADTEAMLRQINNNDEWIATLTRSNVI
ncbi:CaiB/BaiF CoA transferase family protein [Halopseudomonas pelagia]|uniref:CoA transferase n=1 Tax=Halopseudomonas pelagia TaxID=553151 RepID=A0AA91U101_9GAMM|nr:CoA transferase [Halopseudomonas pelagia]PCC98590.1 CoA transferase [Halopseudomonas pelagia]QFY55552.1 CoA transferase [Halopseudomonas pelagia]